MRAYSDDLRQRIVQAVDQGHRQAEIAAAFQVSLATIKRYLKQRRETGHVTVKPIPGRPPKQRAALEAELPGQLAAYKDATLAEHCRLYDATHGQRVSRDTMRRATLPPGLDLEKKSVVAAERSDLDRAAWHDLTGYLPINDLVLVDECGSTIALTRLYARAPRGQRAYGSAPRNWGKNTTLIAGLTLSGIQAPFILEGAVDALAFETYVDHVLAPSLSPGQVVVLDNVSVHKGERVRQAIEARGCQVLFLPAYSPDLTPIEEAFSKLKTWLRRLAARTHEALEEAIGEALKQITVQDARGWFWHCGYLPKKPGKESVDAVPAT